MWLSVKKTGTIYHNIMINLDKINSLYTVDVVIDPENPYEILRLVRGDGKSTDVLFSTRKEIHDIYHAIRRAISRGDRVFNIIAVHHENGLDEITPTICSTSQKTK